jgi:hypothetical protein
MTWRRGKKPTEKLDDQPMAEPDLNFIARQLANLIGDVRSLREELSADRLLLGLLREEVRIATSMIRRLDDTIRMNVMDRLQALEAGESAP